MNFISSNYQLWKALHIVFMVCWFASLFYLPRFFVYHSQALEKGNQEAMEYFRTMEKKLYIIGHISMGLMIIFALLLVMANHFASFIGQGWMHVKMLLVVLLIAFYLYCGKIMKQFTRGINPYSETFYRWFNEFPGICLILIVILACLKPF